jgi:hypothetical protein
MAMSLKINGTSVKTPASFEVSYADIDADSSGRNANGTMVRDVIVKNKTKLSIKWAQLSVSESKAILLASDGDFFTVEYPDVFTGVQTTKTFYAGDRSAGFYSWNDKFQAYIVKDFGFDCIER